jgi:hypothetical protein
MNIPLYTTQGPEILILKVTAGAPAVDFNSNRIFAGLSYFGDIEF